MESKILRCAAVFLGMAALNANLPAQSRNEIALMPDARIQQAVEGELRQARAVDANTIDVKVSNDIAILQGIVRNILSEDGTADNLHERQLAAENALEGGALRVFDRLNVTAPNWRR
jgi:BON domain